MVWIYRMEEDKKTGALFQGLSRAPKFNYSEDYTVTQMLIFKKAFYIVTDLSLIGSRAMVILVIQPLSHAHRLL